MYIYRIYEDDEVRACGLPIEALLAERSLFEDILVLFVRVQDHQRIRTLRQKRLNRMAARRSRLRREARLEAARGAQ